MLEQIGVTLVVTQQVILHRLKLLVNIKMQGNYSPGKQVFFILLSLVIKK